MCKFARRCRNFLADPQNERSCVIICNKNPNLMMIFEAPDRFMPDIQDEPVDERNLIVKDESKKEEKKMTVDERKEKAIEDLIKVIDNNTGEMLDFETEFEDFNKEVITTDPTEILKKIRNNPMNDEKIVEAIEGEIPEGTVLDASDYEVEPVEVEVVANVDEKKPNIKDYIPTGNVGRPTMTDEEKAEAKKKRDAEKAILDKEKAEEQKERADALKQQRIENLRKAREARKKKKEAESSEE